MPSVEDLQPKPFTVTIKGMEYESKPLRLSHALMVSKIGAIFNDVRNSNLKETKQAETDLDLIIADLIPDIKDAHLDLLTVMDLLAQLMDSVQPTEQQELEDNNIEISEKKTEEAGL